MSEGKSPKWGLLREFIIQQKIRMDVGRANLGIFQWLMLMFVAVKTALPAMGTHIIILATLGTILVLWFIGFFWDKTKMYEEEVEFSNKRNRFIKEVRNDGIKVKE